MNIKSKLEEEFKFIGSLPDNWDGAGTKKISKQAISESRKITDFLVNTLGNISAKKFGVAQCQDSSVDIFIDFNGKSILINTEEVDGETATGFYGSKNDSEDDEIRGNSLTTTEELEKIASWLLK